MNDRVANLELVAARARRNVVRMIETGNSGHLGGAMSAIDVITALYFDVMNVDPARPEWPDRDRFLLSAGHKAMAQYAVLAERGFFDKSVLDTYGAMRTALGGHPDMHKLPGVEATPVRSATGCRSRSAWRSACACSSAARVFAVTGDGELPEDPTGRPPRRPPQGRLAGRDRRQQRHADLGPVDEVMNMAPIAGKFEAFSWASREIDGNDMAQVLDALDATPFDAGRPSVIVAHTDKGKGLSFAENVLAYHYWKPKDGELEQAVRELDEAITDREVRLRALRQSNTPVPTAPGRAEEEQVRL